MGNSSSRHVRPQMLSARPRAGAEWPGQRTTRMVRPIGPGAFSMAQNAHSGDSIGHRGIRWATDHIGGDTRVLVSSPVSLNVMLEQWRGRSEQPDSSCALAISGNRNLAIDRRASGGPRNRVTGRSAGCTMLHAGRASFTSTEVVYG
jgi:hypothetical protein